MFLKPRVLTHIMPFTFENRCEFPENSVGKLIVCREGDRILLYGRMVVLPELIGMSWEEAKRVLRDLMVEKQPDTPFTRIRYLVGDHIDLPKSGVVLGGTQALYRPQQIFLYWDSGKYDGVHPGAVQKCLPTAIIEHEKLGGRCDYSGSLEQFLRQQP